jgi:hypothetical protein
MDDKIQITYKENGENKEVFVDPWNNWVFRLSLGGSLQGEKYQQSYNIRNSARISRITEDWKIRFDLSGSYYEDKYNFEDENLVSSASSKSISASAAYSISNPILFLGPYRF